MSSGPLPAPQTLLSSPLPCWHESLHAARSELIVALSPRSARIATDRPIPVGTPVFLELGVDAGIDAMTVASETNAFVVEFVTVDAAAAALIAEVLREPAAGAPVVVDRGWLDEVTPVPHDPGWPSTTTSAATAEATAAPAMHMTGFEARDDARETTARWPAARVARVETPPQWASSSLPPTPTAPPPLSLDDAEDIVLEFTAPPRPAMASRPLPAPENNGVVEVDFSEFHDVLGVATFKTDAPQPTALQGRVSTPQPVAITLPRTPSMSRTPAAPAAIPSEGNTGAGPDAGHEPTLPAAPEAAASTASVAEQWVVTAPGLAGPRLGHGGINAPHWSPATSSASTTTPAPFPTPMTTTPPPMLTPPTRPTAAAGPSPAPSAPRELPPISMDEHDVVTAPGGLAHRVGRRD